MPLEHRRGQCGGLKSPNAMRAQSVDMTPFTFRGWGRGAVRLDATSHSSRVFDPSATRCGGLNDDDVSDENLGVASATLHQCSREVSGRLVAGDALLARAGAPNHLGSHLSAPKNTSTPVSSRFDALISPEAEREPPRPRATSGEFYSTTSEVSLAVLRDEDAHDEAHRASVKISDCAACLRITSCTGDGTSRHTRSTRSNTLRAAVEHFVLSAVRAKRRDTVDRHASNRGNSRRNCSR